MNEDIIVELEGRNIIIPEALPETIKVMQDLVPLRNQLISEAEKVAERYNPDNIYATPMCCYSKMYDVLQDYVDIYNARLKRQYGSDAWFASFPQYLDDYCEVSKAAEERVSSAYRQQADNCLRGMRLAESEAMKEIKGMQFGVVTNKLSSALIYTGMSAVTYASQARRADQVYNKIMNQYSSYRAESLERSIMSKEIVPLIYPVAEKTTAGFLQDVMKNIGIYSGLGYRDLSERHKTHVLASYEDYVFGDTIALREAINKLEEIDEVVDNHTELLNILEDCPYCPEVYFKMFDVGMLNKTILSIAKLLHIDNIVNQHIKSEVSSIKHRYTTIRNICINSKDLKYWIENHIGLDKNKIIIASENLIEDKVKLWLDEILDEGQYEELINLDLVTVDDIRMKGDTHIALKDIKVTYIEKITLLVMDYIKQIKDKKIAYEEAYNKFNAGSSQRKSVIEEKRNQLNSLGLFAFSAKKKMKVEIAQLEAEYNDYLKTEPIELENAYFNM